jgi:LPS export ABC transporter protein LptC
METKRLTPLLLVLFSTVPLFSGCSFQYPSAAGDEDTKPDIIMEELDYTRVRGGERQAEFSAVRAERYDKRRVMELRGLSFSQYNQKTGERDAQGTANFAEVELHTGNIRLRDGINLRVDSEDVDIETETLEWNDDGKTLRGGEEENVMIRRNDGTDFRGKSLSVDVRTRRWEFASGGSGIYTHNENNDGDPDGNGFVMLETSDGENFEAAQTDSGWELVEPEAALEAGTE